MAAKQYLLPAILASSIGITAAWFETLTNYYHQNLTPPPAYHPLDSIHSKDQGFKAVLAYLDNGASRHFGWRPDWTPGDWTGWPGWSHIRDQPHAHGLYPLPEPGSPYLADAPTDLAVDYIHRHAQFPASPFLLYLSHYAVHTTLQARPEVVRHFENKRTRGWDEQTNAVYAGLLKALDDSVGRVVQALKDTGQFNNTIIVFLSDNGGLMGATVNAPLRAGKAFLYEGGVRVPLVISRPKHFAPAWCDVPVCAATDIMPTLAALTGSQVPATDRLDGESLLPLLTDAADTTGGYQVKPIYWSYPFNCALIDPETGLPLPPASSVRDGDYKLIWNWAGTLELYDIAKDIDAQHNLAAAKPELALHLYQQLVKWLDPNVERRYLPTPNPDYQAQADPRRLLYPFRDLRQSLLNLTMSRGAQFGTRTGTLTSGGSNQSVPTSCRVNAAFQSGSRPSLVRLSKCALSRACPMRWAKIPNSARLRQRRP